MGETPIISYRHNRHASIEPFKYPKKPITRMKLVPISAIGTHNYCQCQIILRYIRKMHPGTDKVYDGITAHRLLDTAFIKSADIEDTVDNIVIRAKKENTIFCTREIKVRSKEHRLVGRIDEVELHPEKVIIIDDKPNAKAYMSSRLQVTGYCIAFKDNYNIRKDIYAAVRDRDTGVIVWMEKFNSDSSLAKTVELATESILELTAGTTPPVPQKDTNRCASCGYLDRCTYRRDF